MARAEAHQLLDIGAKLLPRDVVGNLLGGGGGGRDGKHRGGEQEREFCHRHYSWTGADPLGKASVLRRRSNPPGTSSTHRATSSRFRTPETDSTPLAGDTHTPNLQPPET